MKLTCGSFFFSIEKLPPLLENNLLYKRNGLVATASLLQHILVDPPCRTQFSGVLGSVSDHLNESAMSTSRSKSPIDSPSEDDVVNELRRGPWTPDEDALLMHYISSHGEGRWNLLAKCSGLRRTGKSCRLRWLNYLKPDVKRGNLTLQEQLLILELHSKWGNRWSKIAQQLPGRTDNEIKNYWRTRVLKQARQLNIDSDSAAFQNLIRCFWVPRLLQKIEGSSSTFVSQNPIATTQPQSGYSSELVTPQMFPMAPLGTNGNISMSEDQSSRSFCSSETMNVCQVPDISEHLMIMSPYYDMGNITSDKMAGGTYCGVDIQNELEEQHSMAYMSASRDHPSPAGDFQMVEDPCLENDLAGYLWDMDESITS